MSWFVYNSNGKLLQSLVVSDNAVTNAKMADDAIGVAELSASGTASSSTFLRGDNAWVAPAGGPSQATQSALEAETNEDTYAPPDLVKHSPGVAKAWASITSTGALSSPDYGIASVDDDGTGDHDINFTTAFSSIIFSCLATVAGEDRYIHIDLPSSTSEVQMNTKLSAQAGNNRSDTARYVAFFGDQA